MVRRFATAMPVRRLEQRIGTKFAVMCPPPPGRRVQVGIRGVQVCGFRSQASMNGSMLASPASARPVHEMLLTCAIWACGGRCLSARAGLRLTLVAN
jgi:hypothetical protein